MAGQSDFAAAHFPSTTVVRGKQELASAVALGKAASDIPHIVLGFGESERSAETCKKQKQYQFVNFHSVLLKMKLALSSDDPTGVCAAFPPNCAGRLEASCGSVDEHSRIECSSIAKFYRCVSAASEEFRANSEPILRCKPIIYI
jgi:hypothetical protein